ncbi:alpha/beta hydrolase family esterase [Amycolatopsis alkalitolerans]|uniref:Polyhydroxybutyrate depolymerase n=1 Tax=Amycolatopsis alkalitolerans TaxID=2547244 RepID=A0A5C4M5F2_9PSEU|nr:hypothetical protein [Amycolatopsis alkalitolerans]TNC26960.1 hypothetical protein FG385_11040 [Amycolatopsis alkalitolerans]
MRRLVVLIAAATTLAACASPSGSEPVRSVEPVQPAEHTATAAPAVSTGAGTVQRELTVDGMKRTYLAVRSAKWHKGLPLLIVMHGRGITAQLESRRTGFLPYAEGGLVNIVYPMGIARSWNAGYGCCGVAGKEGVHDMAFLTEVAADASRYFESDLRRTYLVGYSNGARLSFSEVCGHPGVFAGLATYGAVPLAPCAGGRPIPALLADGSDDAVVRNEHFSPSSTIALSQAVTRWQGQNGCTGPGAVRHIGALTLRSWTGCRSGADLSSAVYSGLTHFWPRGTHEAVPYTTYVGPEAAASTIMWSFLSRQHLS